MEYVIYGGTALAALGAIVSAMLVYHISGATWFTDKIGWRYVCIVNGPRSYKLNLRLAKKLPELKHLVNRNCFWRTIKYPYWVIIGAVLLPLWLPWLIMELLRDRIALPDPHNEAVRAILDMDKIVPSWKQKKAMGLPVEPIFEMDYGDENKS